MSEYEKVKKHLDSYIAHLRETIYRCKHPVELELELLTIVAQIELNSLKDLKIRYKEEFVSN